MAFPQPNAQRDNKIVDVSKKRCNKIQILMQKNEYEELANRKILEELQIKKQMLLKQGAAAPSLTTASVSLTSTPTTTQLPVSSIPPVSANMILPQMSDTHMINTSQRAALNNANATSCGFFVPQDSSFGNQILPVLPRFDA